MIGLEGMATGPAPEEKEYKEHGNLNSDWVLDLFTSRIIDRSEIVGYYYCSSLYGKVAEENHKKKMYGKK